MQTSAECRATKILVADNDPMIRGVLRGLLKRLGFDPVAVENAEQALSAARAAHIGLFVLDLDMPGVGGLGACRALREMAAYRETPIAILTGHQQDVWRLRSLEAGATLFLVKPFNPAELLRALTPFLALDEAAKAELARVHELDRGLRLQDTAFARTAALV